MKWYDDEEDEPSTDVQDYEYNDDHRPQRKHRFPEALYRRDNFNAHPVRRKYSHTVDRETDTDHTSQIKRGILCAPFI